MTSLKQQDELCIFPFVYGRSKNLHSSIIVDRDVDAAVTSCGEHTLFEDGKPPLVGTDGPRAVVVVAHEIFITDFDDCHLIELRLETNILFCVDALTDVCMEFERWHVDVNVEEPRMATQAGKEIFWGCKRRTLKTGVHEGH